MRACRISGSEWECVHPASGLGTARRLIDLYTRDPASARPIPLHEPSLLVEFESENASRNAPADALNTEPTSWATTWERSPQATCGCP